MPIKNTQGIDNRSGVPLPGMRIIGQNAEVTVVDLPQTHQRVDLFEDRSFGWLSSFPEGQRDRDIENLNKWIGKDSVCYVSSDNGKPIKPTFPMRLNTFEIAVNPTVGPGVIRSFETVMGERPGQLVALANYMRTMRGNKETNELCEAAKLITPTDLAVSAINHSGVMHLMQAIDKKRNEFLLLCNKIIEFYVMLPAIIACDPKGFGIGCVCYVDYCIVGFGKKRQSRKKSR